MGDGWSDKSVSPAVYTPAAENDPQLEIDVIDMLCQTSHSNQVAAITTKITPAHPLFFGRVFSAGELESGWAPLVYSWAEADSDTLFCVKSSSTSVRIYRLTLSTETLTTVQTVTAPTTFSTATGCIRKLSADRWIIVGMNSRAMGVGSADSGATWANTWDTGAVTGLVVGQISGASSSGNYCIAGNRTIGGVAQPVAVVITGWTTATVVDMPAVSGMTAAAFNGIGCVRVADGVFVLAARPASGNYYFFVSTDSGATWTHAYTTSGTTLSAGGYGVYCGNNAAIFSLTGSSNLGKIVSVTSSGTVFATYSTPNNVGLFLPCDRIDFSRNEGMQQNGYAFGWAYYGSYGYSGIYATQDYGANWTQLTTEVLVPTYVGCLLASEYSARIYFPFSLTSRSSGSTSYMFIGVSATHGGVERFVTQPTTAAFTAISPAKLASLGDVTPQINTTGRTGTVKLYMQHYNDEIAVWSSLADVADDWSDCGAMTNATPLTLPAHTCRAGEKFRFKIGFTATDSTGIQAAPELESLSFVWNSDVTAPDAPSITRIINTTVSGQAGYRVDFGDLPTGARHLIAEGKLNDADYVPLSNRAKFEADNGYLRFRGDLDAIEAAGERNETHFSAMKELAIGDVVQVKIAAEDDVGNRSAFVESDPLTLVEQETVLVPTDEIEARISTYDEITVEVDP